MLGTREVVHRPEGLGVLRAENLAPQREHFLDLAGALLDYIEEGGAVCYLMGGAGPQDQEVVSFAVDRRLFREYERKRAAPRRRPPPRWVPGRGFSWRR